MSVKLSFNLIGLPFAENYITNRSIVSDISVEYIKHITELLCLLTNDSRLPSEFVDKFIGFLVEIEKTQTQTQTQIQIPYDYIAHFVYKNTLKYDFSNFSIIFDEIIDAKGISSDAENIRDLEKVVKKIQRNIQLAMYQKEFIEERVAEANSKVEALELKAAKVDKQTKKIERKAKTLLQDIYSSFITILGIFSAIIVAAFGGVSILGASLSKLDDLSSYMLFLSTGTLGLLLITYYLVGWVDQLRKPVGETNNIHNDNFVWAVILLVLVACISILFKLPNREATADSLDKLERVESIKDKPIELKDGEPTEKKVEVLQTIVE